MNDRQTLRVVLTALFAALVGVATIIIRVPSPTGGFVNAGDAVVLLSGFLLGPLWGAVASGIGAALADLLTGYPVYAPGTLVIKALMALLAGALCRRFPGRPRLGMLLGGLCGETVMVLGYFAFSALALSYGMGALASVPGNLTQAVFGITVSTLLGMVLLRSPYVRELLSRFL